MQEDDRVMKSTYFDQMFEKQSDRFSAMSDENQLIVDESETDQNKLVFLVEDEIPAEPEPATPESTIPEPVEPESVPVAPEPEKSIIKDYGEWMEDYKFAEEEVAVAAEEPVIIEPAVVVDAESDIRNEVKAESEKATLPASGETRIKALKWSSDDETEDFSDGRFDYII